MLKCGDFVLKGQCLQRLGRTWELWTLAVCRHKNSFVCGVALLTS